VETEIQRLIGVRHPNLLSVFAVKLTFPYSSGLPQLVVLTEQRPSMTLQDVLEDCDFLKEERASVCLRCLAMFLVLISLDRIISSRFCLL
jgi:translation initiation factor 2-alpha kinase 4